jgi:hypothetical protein
MRDIERASDLTEVSGNEIPRVRGAAKLLLNLAAQSSIPKSHAFYLKSEVDVATRCVAIGTDSFVGLLHEWARFIC